MSVNIEGIVKKILFCVFIFANLVWCQIIDEKEIVLPYIVEESYVSPEIELFINQQNSENKYAKN